MPSSLPLCVFAPLREILFRLAFYLITGRSPHDCGSLLDIVTDDDLILSRMPVTPAEAKLVAVAKFAMRKAIVSRPHSVEELGALFVNEMKK